MAVGFIEIKQVRVQRIMSNGAVAEQVQVKKDIRLPAPYGRGGTTLQWRIARLMLRSIDLVTSSRLRATRVHHFVIKDGGG